MDINNITCYVCKFIISLIWNVIFIGNQWQYDSQNYQWFYSNSLSEKSPDNITIYKYQWCTLYKLNQFLRCLRVNDYMEIIIMVTSEDQELVEKKRLFKDLES